jgi:hypothetical protein
LPDYVCKQVKTNISTTDTGGVVEAMYMNNQSIFIPHWYVNYNGHNLEKKLKTTFHKLGEFRNEAAMKMAIIEEVLGPTLEVFVTVYRTPLRKKMDPRYNAAVIDLTLEK